MLPVTVYLLTIELFPKTEIFEKPQSSLLITIFLISDTR